MFKSEPATEFLGIRLVFMPTELQPDQEEYIDKMLKRFNMSDCKSCSTPLEPKCTPAEFGNSEPFEGPFRELTICPSECLRTQYVYKLDNSKRNHLNK
ncbi:hypothetical protein AVEN_7930-1 [Araneus ventricosus]|uniref:Uncharacterized protein n=1 Tax=Araneus ventricosus TaxID=182803 RepID=A0A4Y2D3Y6_ARAVE|nr:hypothetical protein AVEN_7930-1 [Araneus ventricosus]